MNVQINLDTLALVKHDLPATEVPSNPPAIRQNNRTCTGGWPKRATDIALASLAIATLALPMLAVAILVRVTMGGPVIFRHARIGLGGIPFECLKFRSMIVGSDAALARYLSENPEAAEEWKRSRKLKHDPRITWLGRALRMSSLDELPQLLNVLKGDMSCVGPRPIVLEELELYGTEAEKYLQSRPGLTGLWQVSGRSSLTYAERVALDAAYVNDWSMWKDLKIIVRTVPAMLKSHQTS
ncbi:exopolysaccharide production protein ExoY [Ancylobacter sp. 3268]|uniref:sugar transferase n=1 Tax=Ancylobacter sp. 3268 TaxID=2817752 RepID=UPI002866617A|nr:sugar transferase [Ancylobacter sp. 3268]MDR6955759.1 exopolysaccharide production protein ExoY [Ancylobacter sp. 3268]